MDDKELSLNVSAKVFVGDPPPFDQNVFELWLSNMAPEKAAKVRARERGSLVPKLPNQDLLLLDDTLDQYRTYSLLQHYLSHPMLFLQSSPIPLAPHIRSAMIGLYYDVDTSVARWVLGKKLDTRRDYEDLVEATNLSSGYCRRHYDNFRRVYKHTSGVLKQKGCESGDKAQNLLAVIEHDFHLSHDVAMKFAVIVFLCKHRFETLRKRLLNLDFAAFHSMSTEMMHRWTAPNHFLIDLQFLDTLRHVSDLLKDSKVVAEYHELVVSSVSPISDLVTTKFPQVLKTLLKISSRLTSSKEFRDLFVDICEKVIDPYKNDGDLGILLLTLLATYPRLKSNPALTSREGFAVAWTSFLRVAISCVENMTD
eukprot:GGOE01041139.1.p1 GENE.GGOE01041139.1~~GGOE01041139.1.p1  ORF type:complete len:367 (+),score=84.68 GGOE01041139.1:61-1161(+)